MELNHLEKLLGHFPEADWDFWHLSCNPNVSIKTIRRYSNYPWHFGFFSRNPTVTIDVVINNMDSPWDFGYMSSNPNITMDIIKKYPNFAWNIDQVSVNISPDEICSSLEMSYKYRWDLQEYDKLPIVGSHWHPRNYLLYDDNITINSILEYPGSYDYCLSAHPNLTVENIFNNPSLPWTEYSISCNPNLTYEIIIEYFSIGWNFRNLSANYFDKHPVVKNRLAVQYIEQEFPIKDLGNIIISYLGRKGMD